MADFSVYPDAIDGYSQLPLVVDNVTRIDAVTVNRLRSAIINIENELGVQPSDVYDTVKERLDAIEASIDEIINSGDSILPDLSGNQYAVLMEDPPGTIGWQIIEDINLQGGFQIVEDETERDNIAAIQRKEGMIVYLNSTGFSYRLEGGITNSDWILIPFGENLGYKNPARVATLANISNLSSGAPNTLDGISLEEGDRILVHQQTSGASNGIYEVVSVGSGSNGVWTRAGDANTTAKLIPGSEIYVVEGDTYGTTKFWLVTPGPYTLGVTALQFIGGLSIMQSDAAPTTILSATAIGASEAAATSTNSISVRNFKEIDFSFAVATLGSISEIRAQVLYSILASPDDYDSAPEDWNLLLAEEIDTGIATVDPYTLSLTVSDYPLLASPPGSFAFRSPIVGLHMMVLIWSETGSPVGSSFTGYALRRI